MRMTPNPIGDTKGIANRADWRGSFENTEINALHAECFEHRFFDDDWWSQVNKHSFGWVCIRRSDRLVGFVNVAWDGGLHAFILDTMVAPEFRHQRIAQALIQTAVEQAKQTGCEWLHVDFEPHLRSLYFDACGFRSTDAGIIRLK